MPLLVTLLIPLLFSLISPPTLGETDVACCSLSRDELTDLSNITHSECPGSYRLQLATKCQLCPDGTCRHSGYCHCPRSFLNAIFLQSQCVGSFGSTWPDSIGLPDRDWRSCQPSFSPPPPSDVSCCDLPSEKLIEMRGTSDDCPGTNRHERTQKCTACPPGTCRFVKAGIFGIFHCLCPDAFLDSSSLQGCCKNSFGAPWPHSVGKEDRYWRSCKADSPMPSASAKSCCSQTKEELTQLLGTNGNCPGLYKIELQNKCDECPPGTCRVGYECHCPDGFLETQAQSVCRSSFGTDWPESVGKEDVDWRSCATDAVAPPISTQSCCALSEEKLTDLRGTSADCPGTFASLVLLEECQACVPGTCRVGNACKCPDFFLNTDSLKQECLEAFGAAWPESVGKEDREMKDCSGVTVPPPTSTAATGGDVAPVPGVGATKEPEDAVEEPAANGESGSSNGEEEDSSSTGGGSNEPKPEDFGAGEDKVSEFSTIEVVGSVAGVISAVAAVAAGAWALYRHKKNSHAKEATEEMFVL